MFNITVSYKLTPGIIQYRDKVVGEFRSAEVIQECLAKFPRLPVTKVETFDNFPTCEKLTQGDAIGKVNEEVRWDGSFLELNLELEESLVVTEVRVAWDCQIKHKFGIWEGQPYQEIQTNLTPKWLMVR